MQNHTLCRWVTFGAGTSPGPPLKILAAEVELGAEIKLRFMTHSLLSTCQQVMTVCRLSFLNCAHPANEGSPRVKVRQMSTILPQGPPKVKS